MFSKTVVAALALAPFITSSLAQDCSRSYTVEAGDYCDKISAEQNVSTYQLAALNAGAFDDECSNLQPGQELCLGTEGEDCQDVYVVQSDDSCEIVAEAFGFNTTLLYTNNPQLDEEGCSNLYIGEVLCVATEKVVPPEPSGTTVATEIPSTATPVNAVATGVEGDDDEDQLPWCDEL